MSGHFKDIAGLRFGRLVAIARVFRSKGSTFWSCECDCGNPHIAAIAALMQGTIKSCGCLRDDVARAMMTTHGWWKKDGKKTPEAMAYYRAKGRCNNPKNDSYYNYGARGIKFLFTSFMQFLEELGPRPSEQHTLDRINNDGNYEPGNVRWATRLEQAHNTRLYYNGIKRKAA